MNYFETVREFITDNFLFGDGEKLKEDTSFLERGIVDSTGILEIVNFLEETYKITVQDDELIPENLNSLRSISNYLEKKISK